MYIALGGGGDEEGRRVERGGEEGRRRKGGGEEEGRRWRSFFWGFGMEKIFLKRKKIFKMGDFFHSGVK